MEGRVEIRDAVDARAAGHSDDRIKANIDLSLSLQEKILSAVSAAGVAAIVTTPLDVLKTRLQVNNGVISNRKNLEPRNSQTFSSTLITRQTCPPQCPHLGSSTLLCAKECYSYHSTTDALRKIVRREGVVTLWRGVDVTLMTAVPTVGIYLPLYESLNNLFKTSLGPEFSGLSPIFAGSSARTFAVCCTMPLEVARTRVQATSRSIGFPLSRSLHHNSAAWSEIGKVLQGSGVRGLWSGTDFRDKPIAALQTQIGTENYWGRMTSEPLARAGLSPTLLRDVPFSAIYWYGTEIIRDALLAFPNLRQETSERDFISSIPTSPSLLNNWTASLLSGTASGAIAAFVTTPFDVVKTRWQVENAFQRDRSILMELQSMFNRGGLRELFVGALPRTARAAPACGIVLSCYEGVKMLLGTQRS